METKSKTQIHHFILFERNFDNVHAYFVLLQKLLLKVAYLSFMQGKSVVEMLKYFKNFPRQNQLLAMHRLSFSARYFLYSLKRLPSNWVS